MRMRREPQKTGDYGIGLMIHAIHMTDDVARLNKFYADVFGGQIYVGEEEPSYLPAEDRWASLIQVSDLCIEAMAPNLPVDASMPVGRFYAKFGHHLHSVGYQVDDLTGLGDSLIAGGIHIGRPGGGHLTRMDPGLRYIFPSPRDMFGLMAEMCSTALHDDPRAEDDWSSRAARWEQNHPLTIRRLAYVMLGVKDLDAAVDTYVNRVQAVPLQSGFDEMTGARFQLVQLGDSLLKILQPADVDSDLGRHVARFGNMIYAIAFRVADLDSAERWLKENRIGTRRPTPTSLAADPADTWGAPYFFTTDVIPDDPFGD
jgi:hypothetical protein